MVYRPLDDDFTHTSFHLHLADRESGERRRLDLGQHPLLSWPYRFSTVEVLRVRILRSESHRARVHLKGETDPLEFMLTKSS